MTRLIGAGREARGVGGRDGSGKLLHGGGKLLHGGSELLHGGGNDVLLLLIGADVGHTLVDLSDEAGGTGVLALLSGDHVLDDLGALNLSDVGGLNDASSVDLMLLNNGALSLDEAGNLLDTLAGDHHGALDGLDDLARHSDSAGLLDHVLLMHDAGDLDLTLDGLEHSAGLLDLTGVKDSSGDLDDLVLKDSASVLLGDHLVLEHGAGHVDGSDVHDGVGLLDSVSNLLEVVTGLVDSVGHILEDGVLSGDHLGHLHVVCLGDSVALHLDNTLNGALSDLHLLDGGLDVGRGHDCGCDGAISSEETSGLSSEDGLRHNI